MFFVSAGRFTHWPTYLTFLDDQAEGFRARHLHFAIEPAAGAAGEGEPVRPGVEAALVLGRQPVQRPLLPLLGARAGVAAGGLEDAVPRARAHRRPVRRVRAGQPAGAGRAVADRSRRSAGCSPRCPASSSCWPSPCSPSPTRRSTTWRAPASTRRRSSAATRSWSPACCSRSSRDRRRSAASASRLALAGVCWALAFGCRASIAPAVAAAGRRDLLAGCAAPRAAQRWRLRARALAWLGTPMAVGVALPADVQQAPLRRLVRLRPALPADVDPRSTRLARRSARQRLELRPPPARVQLHVPVPHAITGHGRAGAAVWLHPADGYIVYEPVIGCLLALPWAWLAPVDRRRRRAPPLGARRAAGASADAAGGRAHLAGRRDHDWPPRQLPGAADAVLGDDAVPRRR